MQDTTTTVRLVGCSKTFPDGTRALSPINLEIHGGETLVLLGPSGCGKTTLLRILAGLEQPDRGGEVWFNTENVTSRPIEKRNVGMVFQHYALFPNMTVWGNVAYGLKVRKTPKPEIEKTVGDMLAMMRISDLADRRIDQLSGGQRQRVALARAIAVAPKVLLLDEPLTALDALLRDRLRVEIDELLRSLGITTIYVTHDQAEAMALGDRIVVMSKGAIAQIGTPKDIYYQPANDFVADFIGSINRMSSPSGADQDVMFRPEDAVIATDGPSDLQGVVKSAMFLGDRTRLILQTDSRIQSDIIVDTPLRQEFMVGQPLAVSISPDKFIQVKSTEA